jgi:putative membrane protein
MNHRLPALLVALALAAPLDGRAVGQTPPDPPESVEPPPAIADADRRFIRQAAAAGVAGIEIGRMAIDRAVSEQVKTFARAMVADHTATGAALARIAKRKGIALPRTAGEAQQAERLRLAALSGAEFEHAYVEGQLAERRDALARFERQARNGRDPELRRFAAAALPRLKGHLTTAENLARPAKTTRLDRPAHEDANSGAS